MYVSGKVSVVKRENKMYAECDKKHFLFYKKFENDLTCVLEKILKGNLDLISSPSLKIQIIGEKVCLRWRGKTTVC